MHIRGILETALYVEDLDAARDFYTRVLGLDILVDGPPRQVFFRAGDDVLLVFVAEQSANVRTHVDGVGIPMHGTTGQGHMCFRIADDEVDAWRARLEQAGVVIEAEVKWPRGGRSIYFRDPAGNSLEMASPRIWGLPD